MSFKLPPLPYAYDALEPFYDKVTVEIHHGKHHATYVKKLNEALADHAELASKSVEELLANPDGIPVEIRNDVLHNGGGHANHSLFWRTLEPSKEDSPSGPLVAAIGTAFGNFTHFKEKFSYLAETLFGSGWTWLSVGADGELMLSNLPNQESPLSKGAKPILALDLWEHAYYLKFQNRRPEWVESWWNIVNWGEVGELYGRARSGADVKEIYAL